MNYKTIFFAAAIFVTTAILPQPASATVYTYNWSFSGFSHNGSGKFTTSDSSGDLNISDITGIVDGEVITGLSTLGGPDQTYIDSGSYTLDFNGIAFKTASADYDLYYNNAYRALYSVGNNATFGGDSAIDGFTASLAPVVSSPVIWVAAGVPEPASWAMMLVGMGLIGFAARRRQKVGVARV